MKIHYDKATDSLYIELRPRGAVDSREIADGVVCDFDGEQQLVGIDVQEASERCDVEHLAVTGLRLAVDEVAISDEEVELVRLTRERVGKLTEREC
jgi:uncharacterized protein YuzE